MKHWLTVALAVAVAATTATVAPDADAKRLGGGKPAGMQRDMPARTAPDAPPPKPATPSNPQQANPGTPAAAGAAAAAPKRNWMGPLAGLAAGLGIAALLSHFGLGEAAANALMMALLVGAAIFLVMFLLRRFGGGATRGTPALAGAGAGATGAPWQGPVERRAFEPAAPLQPVGPGPAAAGVEAAAVAVKAGVTRAFVPAAFDSVGFGRIAKTIFIRLQAANDAADLEDLRRFTTPELFASLRLDIQERGPAAQHTDVEHVDADVLDVADEAGRQVVSVRFHGRVVEEKGAAPTPFNEVWHLVKPTDGSREWTIAGIEPLAS